MKKDEINQIIKDQSIAFVDLRFTDLSGKMLHLSLPVASLEADFFEKGKYLEEFSLVLMPDLSINQTVYLDPFYQNPTLVLGCNAVNRQTRLDCCRSLACRAENYLKSTGIADALSIGLIVQFSIFDDVRYEASTHKAFYEIKAEAGLWNAGAPLQGGNTGHRPQPGEGHFALSPLDAHQDLRAAIALTLASLNLNPDSHRSGVSGNQCEFEMQDASLVKASDNLQIFKYIVKNQAHNFGKTATFMPKPLTGEKGNGLLTHQYLVKDGLNLFSDKEQQDLSQLGQFYLGGLLKHRRALNALTNQTVNSYRRLAEAGGLPRLSWSKNHKKAALRISNPDFTDKTCLLDCFQDAVSNPYLAFSAQLLAGLDGIQNKIEPDSRDLSTLSFDELKTLPGFCASLEEAVLALEKDQAFLLAGDVFSSAMLEEIMALRRDEIDWVRDRVHPAEFYLSYSS